MSTIIKTTPITQTICHLSIVALWIYWAVSMTGYTDNVLGWITIVVIGLSLLIGGAYLLISEYEEDDEYLIHSFSYGILAMIPLGFMTHYTVITPDNFIYVAIYIGIFLTLYKFNSYSAFISMFATTVVYLFTLFNYANWYDYFITVLILVIGIATMVMTSGKSLTNSSVLIDKDEWWLLILSFAGTLLYSIGILYCLKDYLFTHVWFDAKIGLFILLTLLSSTSRITTTLIGIAGGIVYLFFNWHTISLDFIKRWFGSIWDWIVDGIKWICTVIVTIWIENIWIQWTVYSILGVLIIIGIFALIIRLRETRVETKIVYKEREHLLPMKYIGLKMTCPNCRKTMVKGEYKESSARGIAKTTAKGLLGTGAVGSGAAIGGALGGPFAPITALAGAAIGGALTYFNNKKIDDGINAAFDLWNYEVDGGRTLYFECPLCGETWDETEHYGEIDH